MKRGNAVGFFAGALFGVGLIVSGMTQPSKVIGFLDVTGGAWDASLMFVMLGAIAVHFVAHALLRRWRQRRRQQSRPLFDDRFHLPTRKDIDVRLVLGAAIFGVGWGLGGFCPGPGIVSAAGGLLAAIVFVVGMTVGMKIEHFVSHRS